MKIKGKKLLAAISAIAILSSLALPAFAANTANTATIQSVSVITVNDLGEETKKPVADLQNVSLTPEQLLEVTIKLGDGESPEQAVAAVQATFLSYTAGTAEDALGNGNIQYVDQKPTGEDGTIVVKFRPRASLGTGSFVAKAGGADVKVAANLNYTVALAKKDMTLTLTSAASFVSTSTDPIIVTVKDTGADTYPAALTSVSIDNSALETSAYSYSKENGTLTITTYNNAVGPHSITVAAENYNAPTAVTYTVTAPSTVLPEDKEEAAQEKLDSVAGTGVVEGTETTLTDKVEVDGTNYDVTYTVVGDTPTGVTVANGKVTLDETAAPFAKVVLNAKVSDAVQAQKVIFIIPDGTSVAFGNLGLYTVGNRDAFRTNGDFEAITIAAEDRVRALNAALGRPGALNLIPKPEDTLDFDRNGNIALAEYRIFSRMMAKDPTYLPSEIIENRK